MSVPHSGFRGKITIEVLAITHLKLSKGVVVVWGGVGSLKSYPECSITVFTDFYSPRSNRSKSFLNILGVKNRQK